MITKQYTADRNEIAGDPKSKIPADMANYWINGVNSLISDLQPLKDAGGFLGLVDINNFGVRVNTALNTSYPQLIPMTKISGGLAIASDIITLEKGFIYEVVLQLCVIGTGFGAFRIYNTSNGDLMNRPNIAISANYNSGDSNTDGKTIIDLSGAGANLSIKVVNTYMVGTPTASASYGSLIIKKYKKIPLTAME